MLLQVNFKVFKQIRDFWRTKAKEAKVHYYESEKVYVCYFHTPDFDYLCNVPKTASRIDLKFYIFEGIQIEGRQKDTPFIIVDNKELMGFVEERLKRIESNIGLRLDKLEDAES